MSSFLDRCAAEPFRVFFPLGVLASAAGVLLWPAYFQGWTPVWPLEAHARWMVLGFGGCFVTGFLGTAAPRLLGAEPWCRFEILWHFAMAVAMMACLAFQRIPAADLMAGLWLSGVLLSLLFRVIVGRSEVPPPGLPVAVLGLGGAALAGFALSMDPILTHAAPVRLFWRLLYFQGLLWLPAIGVAPYLLPRFFGRKSPHAFDEGEGIPPGWWRAFGVSLAAGLAVIASFWVEARFGGRAGMTVRTAVVVPYLAFSVPGLIGWSRVNGLGLALRWVLPCAACGWLLAAWFGPLRTGMLHLMFIGGAGLLMLAVASRVTLGHADRHDRLASPLRWFHGVWAMVLFTAATRLTSDFVPKVRVTHFIYAAILWVAVLAFWAWKLRRERLLPEIGEGVIRRRCPRRKRSAVREA